MSTSFNIDSLLKESENAPPPISPPSASNALLFSMSMTAMYPDENARPSSILSQLTNTNTFSEFNQMPIQHNYWPIPPINQFLPPSMPFSCNFLHFPYARPSTEQKQLSYPSVMANPKPKRKQNVTYWNSLKEWQRTILENNFKKTKYPSDEDRKRLAVELGMTESRVYFWFVKMRINLRKEEKEAQVSDPNVDLVPWEDRNLRFSKAQTATLESQFPLSSHPERSVVERLEKETGLTAKQIKQWYVYKRQSLRKKNAKTVNNKLRFPNIDKTPTNQEVSN